MESFQITAIQDGRRMQLIKKQKHDTDNSQEPLNEIGPILCHRRPRMKLLQYFTNDRPKWLHLPLLKTADNMKQTISHEILC